MLEMLSFSDRERVSNMPVNPGIMVDRCQLENFPVYKDFCSFFVSGVVGIRHFDRHKCIQPLSKYVTASDEAFTILTMENNWSRWSDMAGTKNWKDSETPSVWTTSIEKRKPKEDGGDNSDDAETPQARRYRGWTKKGIIRYNQLHAEVKVERKLDAFRDFEKYCLEEFQKEAEEQGRNTHKRRKREPDSPMPIATHDLWDDSIVEEDDSPELAHLLPPGMKQMTGV